MFLGSSLILKTFIYKLCTYFFKYPHILDLIYIIYAFFGNVGTIHIYMVWDFYEFVFWDNYI